ncbi:MAG: TfoX/Sxy family protein [Thermoproteota archaeon]|nr:TfoX/Sxy family protein [Thermoproteota archaeon]
MSNRTTDSSMIELKKKIKSLTEVTTRPMFGYQCYLVNGKFFAGIGRREDKSKIIIRLSKDLQLKALLKETRLKIEPFRQGAKMGWIELDISNIRIHEAFYWVKKGYEHALNISKSA